MTTTQPQRPQPGSSLPLPASYGDRQRTGLTADDLFEGIAEHLFFSLGRSAIDVSPHDLYMALSFAVRDRLMNRHLASKDLLRQKRPKAVAYLSAEFHRSPAGQQPADARPAGGGG